MCDILVALPDSTIYGGLIFGKNSDRPVDDCQVVYRAAGGPREPGEKVVCSYVEVAQPPSILATIGCRPYWCWGYETGMNEAGVVAGNTAIFTRALWVDRGRQPLGLTGMDLLRLGLERCRTAEEFVRVVAELLEAFGQWGSGVPGLDHEAGSYDNAFLVADRNEAWVLETAGRRWVAERISSGVSSISNQPTIRRQWTAASEDLEQFAEAQGWWRSGKQDFDFALCYGDHEHYSRQVSQLRWMRSQQMLHDRRGSMYLDAMMAMLRDHYEDTFLQGPQFHPFLPDFQTICMHDSPAGFTWGNTATSVVIEFPSTSDALPLVWTAYGPPCCSAYIAYSFDEAIPETAAAVGTAGLNVVAADKAPIDSFQPQSLWWRLRRLIAAVKEDPHRRRDEMRRMFDAVESDFLETASDGLQRGFVSTEIAQVNEVIETLEKQWGLHTTTP